MELGQQTNEGNKYKVRLEASRAKGSWRPEVERWAGGGVAKRVQAVEGKNYDACRVRQHCPRCCQSRFEIPRLAQREVEIFTKS